MQPYRPPARRLPPEVYRRRRAVAATVAVLVLFGVARVLGIGSGGSGGSAERTSATSTPSSTTTTLPEPPACSAAEVPVRQDPDTQWDTVLVDRSRAIGPDYGPGDLHDIERAGFPAGEELVRGFVIEDLQAMRVAAEENGTPFSVIAGYRSYSTQAQLYEQRISQLGESEARSRVALPGHSEHQLGTTVDVGPFGQNDVDQSWASTPEGQWIASNAHRFGFVLSYPAGAEGRTCYDYEPWHLRYIGRERAAALVDSGLTLREFLYKLEVETLGPPPSTPTTAES